MLCGRDARLPVGVGPSEVVSKPSHGPAMYLEDLKKQQSDLRKMVMKRVEQSQMKQKRYDLQSRVERCKEFTIGDTVLLKNFRARGLDEK